MRQRMQRNRCSDRKSRRYHCSLAQLLYQVKPAEVVSEEVEAGPEYCDRPLVYHVEEVRKRIVVKRCMGEVGECTFADGREKDGGLDVRASEVAGMGSSKE